MIVLLNLEVIKVLKTLVSRLAKYFHLNLGKLPYEKKLVIRGKVKHLLKHEPKATEIHAAKKNRK